jgi:hypothetical protein
MHRAFRQMRMIASSALGAVIAMTQIKQPQGPVGPMPFQRGRLMQTG